jgi:transcriptional regulator with XRE-family HTH domain
MASHKYFHKALGEEVRHRRDALRISQEELAARAGLHRNAIGRLERGTLNPSVMTLLCVVAEFDIPLSELVICAERRMR